MPRTGKTIELEPLIRFDFPDCLYFLIAEAEERGVPVRTGLLMDRETWPAPGRDRTR